MAWATTDVDFSEAQHRHPEPCFSLTFLPRILDLDIGLDSSVALEAALPLEG